MSLKDSLGIRSHRENAKMFWFELTLLFLLLELAAFALGKLVPGTIGAVAAATGGMWISWAILCAALTSSASRLQKGKATKPQAKLEEQLMLLFAAMAVLERLLAVYLGARIICPVALAGLCVYLIASEVGDKLRKSERLGTREILVVLAAGTLAFVIMTPFFDMIAQVLSLM